VALISAGGCCGQPADAQTTDEPLVVTVTADRPDALYLNGETAAFTIEVTRGGQRADRGEVEVWLSQDGNPTKLEKKRFTLSADAPVRVSGAVDEPAFLLCQTWASVGSAKAYGEKMVWYRGAADTTKTSVELVTDREDALYRCGKPATFSARVTKDGQRLTEGYLEFALAGEIRGQPTTRQVLDLAGDRPLTISGTLDEPGFLYCQARVLKSPDERLPSYRWDTFTSVGFDVEKLRPQSVLPEDFEAFWLETLGKAEELPMDVKLEKIEKACNARADYYRFSIATLNGERVYGFLGIPRGKGPFPAIALYPGHGAGWTMPGDIGLTPRGVITLMMNVHKYPVAGSSAEAQKQMKDYAAKHNVSNYSSAGSSSRETHHFHTILAGFSRAVDYLRSRDDWDGEHLLVSGTSQGGFLTLATAGLCAGRVTAAMAGVPGFCDFNRNHRTDDTALLNTMTYYDAANFARFIRCPVRVSVGFLDGSCPAPGVLSAYNAIPSTDKRIIMGPRGGHTITPLRQAAEREWILQALGLQ